MCVNSLNVYVTLLIVVTEYNASVIVTILKMIWNMCFFSNYGIYLFFRRRVCLPRFNQKTGVMSHRRLETSIAFKGITLRSGLSLRKVHFYLQFRMVTTSL